MKTYKDEKEMWGAGGWRRGILWAGLAALGCAAVAQDGPKPGVRLYVLDGGSLTVGDMASFADDGSLDGREGRLVNPSFLIRHPEGDLLWDTGYGDELAKLPDGAKSGIWHSRLKTPLVKQLADLGLEPSDIEYLALSHLHPDHSGNANLFAGSTFLVHEDERDFMFSEAMMEVFGDAYGQLEKATTRTFQDELDVFGDGTVVMVAMPGHTPGSSVLLVRLEKTGGVLLSGDLFTHEEARARGTVPTGNFDREQTLKSRRAFEDLAAREKARVIVQHSLKDFASLPTPPSFLD